MTPTFIYFETVCNIQEEVKNMNRKNEILNALEKMVDDLYEVGNGDAQYYEEIIGETMDLVRDGE